MSKLFSTTKGRIITGAAALFVLLTAAVATTYFYFGGHALPRTTIAGHSVSGQTQEEVRETLAALYAGQQIEVALPGGETETVDPVEAAVFVDERATVEAVFAPNQSLVGRIKGMFEDRDVKPVVVVNYALLDDYVNSFKDGLEVEAVDAAISLDESTGTFVTSEAVDGVLLDTQVIADEIVAAVASLDNTTIYGELLTEPAAVSTADAEQAIQVANGWLELEISASDGDGSVVVAEPAVVASWIDFTDEGVPEAFVKEELIREWVGTFAEGSNREVVDGIQNVTSSGRIVSVIKEGVPGRQVNNADQITEAIVAAFKSGSSYSAEFAYNVLEPSYDQRLIAEGAENLAYQAAPGEKWIDINLSTFTVTAYEGASAVMSMPHVPGAPLTPTPVGQYAVYAKIPSHTMRGNNVDGTKYETPAVPWTLYYHGGYALHGAYWRSSFGYDAGADGSHGCVNLPVDQAKRLYDWASVGDKVITHY